MDKITKKGFIDLHQDIADNCLVLSGKDFFRRNGLHDGSNDVGFPVNNQVDFPRLRESGARAVFAASCPFVVKGGKVELSGNPSLATFEQINFYLSLLKKNADLGLIESASDYRKIRSTGRIGMVLHIEGADFIDNDGINLETAFNLGVRSIGLTHNERNRLASGAMERTGGLTAFGKKILGMISDKGMITDLAHLNEKSIREAIRIVKPPFMFSHGGLKADLEHPRNISDSQAEMIADKGGLIGIAFAPNLLSKNELPAVAGLFKHLKDIAGIDSIAIGSDFDGIISDRLVEALEDVSKIGGLAKALRNEGFREREIEKVFYRNAENRLIGLL